MISYRAAFGFVTRPAKRLWKLANVAVFAAVAMWWIGTIVWGDRPWWALALVPPFALIAFLGWRTGKWLERREQARLLNRVGTGLTSGDDST